MVVDDHGWLVAEPGADPQVIRYTTVRTTLLAAPKPLGIVWHWTAGRGGVPGWSTGLAKSIMTYDSKRDRAASWHVLIGKDGIIHQSAPFLMGTWHVGRPGKIGGMDTPNVNKLAVGCELENAGQLLRVGSRFYCWPYYLNPDDPVATPELDPHLEVEAHRAEAADGGYWKDAPGGFFDAFTPEQEESAESLLRALVMAYQWTPEVCGYGHVMFDYPRKLDPGPLWLRGALPRILGKIFPSVPNEHS